MWGLLEKITTQVVNYSSSPGQVWYILVFGYRLVVITSLGGSVYGDEQGAFSCSESLVGCENMCYNAFAKISHLRFWAFQLIAISTPTIFFHLFTLHIQSQIEKIKETEKALKSLETGEVTNGGADYDNKMEKDFRKLPRRRNQVGKFKIKEVYRGTEKKEVPQSKRIKAAFIVSLLIRLAVEILFTYFGYQLFNIEGSSNGLSSLKSFLWMRVPALYQCKENGDKHLKIACGQHFIKDGDYIPCWVSRPYEKTVFLRYMNILSFVCMIITMFEVVQFIVRQFTHKQSNQKQARVAYDLEQQQPLHGEPPSFETVMKRSAFGNEAGRIYKAGSNQQHQHEHLPPPTSASLFECVSVEELEKARDKKGHGRRSKSNNKEKMSVVADAPPYESDDSMMSGLSRKPRN